ncbi:hypothetical protein [Natrialba swarupiae]|uniref:Uncharacterized protein n=1 Tax=Natrialba swarupiae TaxID=2448032 RepID=A0A5D5AGL1_9EURY|nr:hypothetical protein [Natrialba swarupiae]TYT60968.1 hypothetical protein FYC77_15860 [Natrialba swarupiae]
MSDGEAARVQIGDSERTGCYSLPVETLRVENGDEPDEVVLFTDDLTRCTEWIAASGSESFVDLRAWR